MTRVDRAASRRKAVSNRWSALTRKAPTARRPRRARVFVLSEGGALALIERRKYGLHYWAVPGGGIEPGESPAEAAIREIREELSLDVTLERRVDQRGAQVYFVAYVDTELPLALGGPEQLRNTPDNYYQPVWVRLETAKGLWLRPPGADRVLNQL